jgi:hypothetical protein
MFLDILVVSINLKRALDVASDTLTRYLF